MVITRVNRASPHIDLVTFGGSIHWDDIYIKKTYTHVAGTMWALMGKINGDPAFYALSWALTYQQTRNIFRLPMVHWNTAYRFYDMKYLFNDL